MMDMEAVEAYLKPALGPAALDTLTVQTSPISTVTSLSTCTSTGERSLAPR